MKQSLTTDVSANGHSSTRSYSIQTTFFSEEKFRSAEQARKEAMYAQTDSTFGSPGVFDR